MASSAANRLAILKGHLLCQKSNSNNDTSSESANNDASFKNKNNNFQDVAPLNTSEKNISKDPPTSIMPKKR